MLPTPIAKIGAVQVMPQIKINDSTNYNSCKKPNKTIFLTNSERGRGEVKMDFQGLQDVISLVKLFSDRDASQNWIFEIV